MIKRFIAMSPMFLVLLLVNTLSPGATERSMNYLNSKESAETYNEILPSIPPLVSSDDSTDSSLDTTSGHSKDDTGSYGYAEAKDEISYVTGGIYSNLPKGEWSIYINDLQYNIAAYAPATAASDSTFSNGLIKLFIMGAVYENYSELEVIYGTEKLDSYLQDMMLKDDIMEIALGKLVGMLGNGDIKEGIKAVNSYCEDHAYTNTSLQLIYSESFENLSGVSSAGSHTSAVDVGQFLTDVYNSAYSKNTESIWAGPAAIPGIPHAENIVQFLDMLSHKESKGIKAGLPENVTVASFYESYSGMTVHNEYSAGIIFDPDNGRDLILVFMSYFSDYDKHPVFEQAISSSARSIYNFYH